MAKKLTLLLDNSGSVVLMNTSTTSSINSSNSSLNGFNTSIIGMPSPPVNNRNGYNKRNSMDSTLNGGNSNSQVPVNVNRVLNQSISESPQKHEQQLTPTTTTLGVSVHRRSLSEHVIMSSSMPADKARCHLLNRANSKLQQEMPICESIPTYSNLTLRKVAETMFLKDPQYKPRPKEVTKLNPFAALAQLRGVKKILGANASNLSPGSTDLFSSCFEIMSSPFLKSLKEMNSQQSHGTNLFVDFQQQQQQPKSLPTSPVMSRRKDFIIVDLDSAQHKKCFDKLQNHPLYKSGKLETEPVMTTEMSSNLPTITTTTIGASATHSYTKLVDKVEPSNVEMSTPTTLPLATSSGFYETPRLMTRRGSTESGFFSCLNEDFCDKTRDSDLTTPYFCTCCAAIPPALSKKDDDSSSVSLRSLDDLELSDTPRYHYQRVQSCPAHRHIDIDARSIDMGLLNRLALDTEINSLIQKHQLSNQLFHCKNRTSSIYSDSSDSLAGSDSLLWDDRCSYQTPNTRSAQIAKIVEYFERKGASHLNFKAPTFAVPEIKPSSSFASSSTASSVSSATSAARNYLPTSNYHHHKQLTDYFVDLRRDFNDISGSSGSRLHRDYEAFCFELAEKKTPQNFHKICEGLVKSKLQLFDKLKQTSSSGSCSGGVGNNNNSATQSEK